MATAFDKGLPLSRAGPRPYSAPKRVAPPKKKKKGPVKLGRRTPSGKVVYKSKRQLQRQYHHRKPLTAPQRRQARDVLDVVDIAADYLTGKRTARGTAKRAVKHLARQRAEDFYLLRRTRPPRADAALSVDLHPAKPIKLTRAQKNFVKQVRGIVRDAKKESPAVRKISKAASGKYDVVPKSVRGLQALSSTYTEEGRKFQRQVNKAKRKADKRIERTRQKGLPERLLQHGVAGELFGEDVARTGRKVAYTGAAALATVLPATRAARGAYGLGRAGLRFLTKAGRIEQKAAKAVRAERAVAAAEKAGRATRPLRVLKPTKGKVALGLSVGPGVAQSPEAIQKGSLGEFKKSLEGTGAFADIGHSLGKAASKIPVGEVGKNLIRDLFDLPAQIVPSIYLPAAAAFEAAAKGDDSRAHMLWDSYMETGIIPKALQGKWKEAFEAAKEHPLYAGLEAAGVRAVVGRTAGAAGRAARIPGTEIRKREFQIAGRAVDLGRESPNLFTQRRQRRKDRRRTPAKEAKMRRRLALQDVRNMVAEGEGVRRSRRDELIKLGRQLLPKGDANRGVLALVVENVVRNEKTFHADLQAYRKQLDTVYRAGKLDKDKAAFNRQTVKAIDKALDSADPKAVIAAADSYIALHKLAEEDLIKRGLLDRSQADKAAVITFARVHMGARYGLSNRTKALLADPNITKTKRAELRRSNQVLDRNGDALSLDAVKAEMKRQGAPESGFVSHRPGLRGMRGAFYRRPDKERQSLGKERRTGLAAAQGVMDIHPDALMEQLSRTRSIADATEIFDRLLARYAHRPDPKAQPHRFKTFKDAERAARSAGEGGINPALSGLGKLVPVRVTPLRGTKREITSAITHLEDEHTPAVGLGADEGGNLIERALTKATDADGPNKGPVVLMPELIVDSLRNHYQASGTLTRLMQAYTGAFKGTVLPTSPKWVLGNIAEANMRSLLSGHGPFGTSLWDVAGKGDLSIGKKLLARVAALDPQAKRDADGNLISSPAVERMMANIVPGGHFAGFRRHVIYRDAQHFVTSRAFGVVDALMRLGQKPGAKQVTSYYRVYRDGVFGLNAYWIERLPQIAQLGKEARRDLQVRTGRWHHSLMVGEGAIDDLARGLLHTDKQLQYAKAVREVYGDWTTMSRLERDVLQSYAPFYLWARAASKFVAITLPTKHPIKTALAVVAAEMTEQERIKYGMSALSTEQVPQFLKGGVPLSGGAILPTQFYTSFGVFSDYPETLGNFILPQFGGLTTVTGGLDWKGDQIRRADGSEVSDEEKSAIAIYTQLEGVVPFLAIARRVLEKGGTSQAGSTFFAPRTTEGSSKGFGAGAKRLLPRTYDAELVKYLRSLSRSFEIRVPIGGAGIGETGSYRGGSSSSGSSSGGGYKSGGSSSSSDSGGYK